MIARPNWPTASPISVATGQCRYADSADRVDQVVPEDEAIDIRSQRQVLLPAPVTIERTIRDSTARRPTFSPTGPLINPGPCETCDAPCVEACPGGAMTRFSGWNVGRCATYHESSDRCKTTCHSRAVCPEGRQHIYDQLEQHYHNDREGGRQAIDKYLGLTSKGSEVGPNWRGWVS